MSGDAIMGFSWSTKNPDQLVTRRGTNPSPSQWTTFVMDVRSPSPIPPPFEFSRFLATSLAFTTQIKTLSLYFDDHLLCKLEKKLAPPQPLTPPNNLNAIAPMQMMKIASVEQTSVQIDAQVLRWTLQGLDTKTKITAQIAAFAASSSTTSFATRMLSAFTTKSSQPSSSPSPTPVESTSTPTEMLATLKASLFLRIVNGNINVSVPAAFSAELERATKKQPPKKTQYQLVWTNKDEFDAGKESSKEDGVSKLMIGDKRARAVFDGLISDLDVQGRVFIGFPTHQTTGFSGSVAARFIPTVERESLDLQAKYVADWNKELLAVGGILARMVYEGEMKEIATLWTKNIPDSTRTWLVGRALHAMQFFTFYASTPAGTVSLDAEQSFFNCDRNRTITVPSSSGPQSAINVRLPNPELATFMKDIPVIPAEVAKNAQLLIGKLRERRLIGEISLEDVFKELESRVFSVEEMRECMNWWIGLTGVTGYDRSLVQRFLRCAVFKYSPIGTSSSTDAAPTSASADVVEDIMPMNTAKTFINIKLIPTDVPVPPHCLPFVLTKSISGDSLKKVFGLNELNLLDFTTHLFSTEFTGAESITESPMLAEKFLNILAKAWSNLPVELQKEITSFLQEKVFIPTRHGMRKTSEAYHSNVTLFQDLAVVCLPSGTPVKGMMEKVLTAIGVRKHVEVNIILFVFDLC